MACGLLIYFKFHSNVVWTSAVLDIYCLRYACLMSSFDRLSYIICSRIYSMYEMKTNDLASDYVIIILKVFLLKVVLSLSFIESFSLQDFQNGKFNKEKFSFRFYYPFGKPASSISLEQQILQRLQAAFDQFPNKQVPKENFTNILKICALPLYWRMPLFHCAVITPNGLCDGKKFIEFWKQ